MKNKMRYIFRTLDYLLWAGFFGILTVYYYWLTSGGNSLMAYFWNVFGISIALFIDKVRTKRIYKKLDLCETDEAKIKLSKKDVTSLKTSLYIFYIFALITNHAITLGALEVSEDVRIYFQVAGHCLIVLFAMDTLIKHIYDDHKRAKEFKEDCGSKRL